MDESRESGHDYSRFSPAELRDISSHVDREKYPDRYAVVREQIRLHEEALKEEVRSQTGQGSVLVDLLSGGIIGPVELANDLYWDCLSFRAWALEEAAS